MQDDLSIHPADTALFVAASLRGYLLETRSDGYALSKRHGDGDLEVVADGLTFKDTARRFGATGSITLRQAAEKAGFKWPDFPDEFLAAIKRL